MLETLLKTTLLVSLLWLNSQQHSATLTVISQLLWHSYMAMIIYATLKYRLASSSPQPYDNVIGFILDLAMGLLVCVESFVLYATFQFNENHYFKICGLCSDCLKHCCVQLIARQNIKHQTHTT